MAWAARVLLAATDPDRVNLRSLIHGVSARTGRRSIGRTPEAAPRRSAPEGQRPVSAVAKTGARTAIAAASTSDTAKPARNVATEPTPPIAAAPISDPA